MKKKLRAVLVPVIILLILSVPLSVQYVKSHKSGPQGTVSRGSVSDPEKAEIIPSSDIPLSDPDSSPKITPADSDITVPLSSDSFDPPITDAASPSVTGSPNADISASPAPSGSAEATSFPKATNTPVPQATNTPVPQATNTPAPKATATPVPKSTSTPAPTATGSPSPDPAEVSESGSKVVAVIPTLKGKLSADEVSRAAGRLTGEAAVSEAIRLITENLISSEMSDYEKIKTIHDYLILYTEYDPNYRPGTDKTDVTFTAYGCLVNRCCVCRGYADAFCAIMDALGIKCIEIDGGGHCWNVVMLDGYWYHIDVTWDANQTAANKKSSLNWGIWYEYFLIPDEAIKRDHTIEAAYDINSKRIDIPVCSSSLYYDTLPELSYPDCIRVDNFEQAETEIDKKLKSGEKSITLIFPGSLIGSDYPEAFTSSLKKMVSGYHLKCTRNKLHFHNFCIVKLKFE